MNFINSSVQRIRSLKTFDSFKIPAYRMFFLGMIGQWGAFSMDMVARSYLTYEITGSAAMLGLLSLANAVPMVALSLFGGAVADRLPKKMLIQINQVVMALIFLVVGISVSVGYLNADHPESWWILMASSVLMGVIMALAMPSRQAIIPELVPREKLMNAISLNTLGMSFFQLVGPAIAGYVIAGFGYDSVFYVMAALNGIATIFTSFLPNVIPAPQSVRTSILNDIVLGFNYIVKQKTILLILLFMITSVLLSMPFQTLMPIFAKDILKVGVAGQGTLMSISGIGALIASLTMASIRSKNRGITFLASNILLGAALVVFAFSVSWPLSLVMMAVVGMGRIGNNTAGNTLLQTHTDAQYLGRVMSIMMLNFGLSSFGTFFAGILAESISAQWAIGGFAMLLIVLSFLAIIFIPGLRKLE
jgi:MFS transporter, DHA1 family, staphyloferrin A biosynthesis exporter